MTKYVTPRGTEYALQRHKSFAMFTFKAVAGGDLPEKLKGQYTAVKYADEAWRSHLANSEKKPDMRLKDNKEKVA